ncbi:hypothetical protein [Streptomyces candidus]|uniref:Uncharacterized protein n=1 Tax=Streptomyces candidus TaxID=67283 RepID=A0A7X0HE71_9ACTN|nr:hypothetical protein [Streptomyces candidus]MBB6435996.1 hypothetical protein [Streptomyces candidus]
MPSTDFLTVELTEIPDVEEALNPTEVVGFYRDTRECAALALQSGAGNLLLSPPTPRPKKG